MTLNFLDWSIIVGFLLINLVIGLYLSKISKKNIAGFFLGGRNLTWWLVGTSMLATTFALDAPLLLTEIVANRGMSGNWLWWNFLIGGMVSTFLFARLWHKAEVITDAELIELRYSGKEAGYLRGFKAIYVGLFLNAVLIACANVALSSLIQVFGEVPENQLIWYIALAMLLVAVYSSVSGLWTVVFTGFLQMVVVMGATLSLAILLINSEKIGGISGLKSHLPAETFHFFPEMAFTSEEIVHSGKLFAIGLAAFLAYIGFQWWTSWYPGAEPGGGTYIAQRMISCKSEGEAVRASFLFQIIHYVVRPFPWIFVGLASIYLYSLPYNAPNYDLQMRMKRILKNSNLSYKIFTESRPNIEKMAQTNANIRKQMLDILLVNKELQDSATHNPRFRKVLKTTKDTRLGYVYAMQDFLPSGLRGLLLAAFLLAYISTISTQMSWGASYLINDFYGRFIQPRATQKQLIRASRVSILLLILVSLLITTQIKSLESVFRFMIQLGAGLGAVLMLRWYWWRINVWSEIVATIAPFVGYALTKFVFHFSFPDSFLITIIFTTIAWLSVTYLTPPSSMKKLKEFYLRIEPQGAWKPVREALGLKKRKSRMTALLLVTLSAIILAYSMLFTLGELLFMNWWNALMYAIVWIISCFVFLYFAKKSAVFQ